MSARVLIGCFILLAILVGTQLASAVNNAGVVMGFESASAWSTTTAGATLGLSTTHTQGSSSLAVHPSSSNGWTPLVSLPLSTLASLSPTVAVDVMLPTQQENPSWLGAVQMYINCPSHNIYNDYLAEIELTGKPLATWIELTFPVTTGVVSSLVGSDYSDLSFTIVLNVAVPTTGTYLFDNLRFVPVSATACSGLPDGTTCTDGNACTQTDACRAGVCVGTNLLECNDNNACTSDGCDPVQGCTHTPVACNVRTGEIQAETYDASNGVQQTPTAVIAQAAGAWVQFNNVDFGSSGTSGRFEISLIGSNGNQDIQLRLGSPTGQLIADLLSLPSAPDSPAPQSVDFLPGVAVSGVNNVVVLFANPSSAALDWFQLTHAHGRDSTSPLPQVNQLPVHGPQVDITTTLPQVDDESGEDDVPPIGFLTPKTPITIQPGSGYVLPIQLTKTLFAVGQARWSGQPGSLTITILDAQSNVLATGTPVPVAGGWHATAVSAPLSAQTVGVIFSNAGSVPLTNVQVYAGGLQ
jgi:hypothetical protein